MTQLNKQTSACNSTHNCEETQGKSCSSSRVMAFIIPFLVVSVSSVSCHGNSMMVALTIGLLADAFGFGLYSLIKTVLRKRRAIATVQHETIKVAEPLRRVNVALHISGLSVAENVQRVNVYENVRTTPETVRAASALK